MISKDEITTEVYACMSAMDQSSLDYVLDALPRLADRVFSFVTTWMIFVTTWMI